MESTEDSAQISEVKEREISREVDDGDASTSPTTTVSSLPIDMDESHRHKGEHEQQILPHDTSRSPSTSLPANSTSPSQDIEEEMTLPPLRFGENGDGRNEDGKRNGGRGRDRDEEEGRGKITRTEIPDSDAFSPVSSPVKGMRVREEEGKVVENQDQEMGEEVDGEDLVMNREENGDDGAELVKDESGSNEVTNMKKDEGPEAVIDVTRLPEFEKVIGSGEMESSSMPEVGSKPKEPLGEGVSVVVQGEDDPLEVGEKINEELEVEDHGLKSPSPEASLDVEATKPASQKAATEDEVLFVRTNDEDTVMTDEGQAQVENVTATEDSSVTGKSLENGKKAPDPTATISSVELRSIPDSDDEELPDAPGIFEKKVPEPPMGIASVRIRSVPNNRDEELPDAPENEEKAAELPTNTTPLEVPSRPDNIDEDLPDAPRLAVSEDFPESEPKPLKKGKGKENVAEETQKPVKKRGRPKKVVVPEVQGEPVEAEMGAADHEVAPMDSRLRTSHDDSTEDVKTVPSHEAKSANLHKQEQNTTSNTTDLKKGKSSPPSPQVSIPSSSAQRSTLTSPNKIRISPNPSFKLPSPVKKNPSTSIPSSPSKAESDTNLPPGETEQSSSITTSPGSQGQNKDIVLAELKAIKIASIQARITVLQAEIEAKKARRDELQGGLKHPAAETVKRHIKLLHDYNDIKDIGQGLVGMIADQRGLRIGELYEEFGVDVKD